MNCYFLLENNKYIQNEFLLWKYDCRYFFASTQPTNYIFVLIENHRNIYRQYNRHKNCYSYT